MVRLVLRPSDWLMPPVLQELMPHENIQTTMRYYVGQNAKRTAAIFWEAHREAVRSSAGPATQENIDARV